MANLTFTHGILIGLSVGLVGALTMVALALWLCRCLPLKSFVSKLPAPLRGRTSPPPAPDPIAPEEEECDAMRFSPKGKPISPHIVREPMIKRPYRCNPIWKHRMNLPGRPEPMLGWEDINEVCSFEGFIGDFVRNYIRYGRDAAPVPEALFDQGQLVRLAGEPANGGTWSESIANPLKRSGAVMNFLAQVLYKRMHPRCDVKESLLPPEVSTFYHYLSQFGKLSWAGPDYLAVLREIIYVVVRWHIGFRRDHVFPFDNEEKEDPRTERTNAMVPEIMDALKLDSIMKEDGTLERAREFLEITFQSAANAAIIMFGEPCEWEAVWVSDDKAFLNYPHLQFIWIDKCKFSRPAMFDTDTSLRLGDLTWEEYEQYKERDGFRRTAAKHREPTDEHGEPIKKI